jgi:hypothetical protein
MNSCARERVRAVDRGKEEGRGTNHRQPNHFSFSNNTALSLKSKSDFFSLTSSFE